MVGLIMEIWDSFSENVWTLEAGAEQAKMGPSGIDLVLALITGATNAT